MALAENPSRICFFLSSMSVLWVILSCSSYSTDAALAPKTLENSILSSLRLSGSDSGSWMEPAEKDTTRYAQSTLWKNNIRRIPDSEFFSAMARVPWKEMTERNGALRNSKRACKYHNYVKSRVMAVYIRSVQLQHFTVATKSACN